MLGAGRDLVPTSLPFLDASILVIVFHYTYVKNLNGILGRLKVYDRTNRIESTKFY